MTLQNRLVSNMLRITENCVDLSSVQFTPQTRTRQNRTRRKRTTASDVRRALGLPFNAHSFFIPPLSCTLPLFEEICKRSACFINECIFSDSALVRSVVSYSINLGRYNSAIYRNLCTVCKLFNWSICDLILGRVCLSQCFFTAYYKSRHSVGESTTISFMSELLKLRDNHLCFSGIFHLDQLDIATVIDYVATV